MTTAVTGATGHLGGLVIEELLARGVVAADVVAIVRDESKASTLLSQGVSVRVADYDDPDSLRNALAGVDRLLLISGSDVGQRLAQHTNVIEAAEVNGVALVAYTSLLHADTSGLSLAPEHVATEARLRESPIAAVILRNGWYWENYLSTISQAASTGTLFGAAGQGRLAAAARADYAAAAAAVLTADTDQAGKVYELGGDERLTYGEFARAIGEASGSTVEYRDLSEDEYQATLVSAGLPEPVAAMLASSDAGIGRGELDTTSGDLQSLIGRSSTPLADVIAQALG
ncbi:SDR family oxidoreductase [Gordonia sp. NPDC058843]|uniref:SDR family oxidoreductase n=1 Tax=Gordonia sp. NPDC058843 TaxID=3346648 RepID=UPI0036AD0AF7